MRYGFYQLHRALFEEREILKLRDVSLAVYSTYGRDNKVTFLRAFENREADPRGMLHLEEVLKWFWASPFPTFFKALYDHEPALMIDFLTVRHHEIGSDTSHVEWHADANFGGMNGPVMVCWVPLDPVGETSPALEFCLPNRKVDEDILRRGWSDVLTTGRNRTVSDGELDRLYGIGNHRVEAHALRVGDCYVFDRYTVHRTQKLARTTRDRYAIEFRIASRTLPPRTDSFINSMILSTRDAARNSIDIVDGKRLYR
jgi:hypothetical protein